MTRLAKSVRDSEITMREMVMPNHTNPQNTIFGGTIMSWVDIAAAMCAEKHCMQPVVTVHVDELSFMSPIKVGYHVSIKASINYVGTSSMIVGVKVESENPFKGTIRTTTKAYLTFVALDEFGKTVEVPDILPETDDDKRRYENAKARDKARKELAKQIN